MKLATLLRRSGTADKLTTHQAPAVQLDEDDALRREWDRFRETAGSEAERNEIDAVFSRAMP